jgi:OOP family OmpA-OmpF porin
MLYVRLNLLFVVQEGVVAMTKFAQKNMLISNFSLRQVLLISTTAMALSACQSFGSNTNKSQDSSAQTATSASTLKLGASTSPSGPAPSLTPSASPDALPPPPSQSVVPQYSDWLFDGPEGRGFAYYLAQGYRRYAKHEDNAHDFEDAAKFLHRAGAVERGERVEPEYLSARILPVWAVDDLVYARQRLMRALNLGAGERLPKIAANAQVAFDCWMEQQEENIQPHDVARCRKDFEGFIVRLEELPSRKPTPLKVGTPMAECPARPEPAACSDNRSFQLSFDLDRYNITSNSQRVVREIADMMKSTSVGYLELAAHADRSGSDAYNDRLSQRRLESTVAALESAGVPTDRITLARHYGETRPAVQTADGVREAANRRVEAKLVCPSHKSERPNQCSVSGNISK